MIDETAPPLYPPFSQDQIANFGHIQSEIACCAMCGSTPKPTDVNDSWTRELWACERCGHLQLPIRPSRELTFAAFRSPYWGAGQSELVSTSSPEWSCQTHFRNREDLFRGTIRALRPDSLCDLRARSGYFVHTARSLGINADGFEPDTELRQAAHSSFGITLRADLPHDLNADDGRYASVIGFGLLDFLIDPAAVLSTSRSLLRRGGHLICDCHTSESLAYSQWGSRWKWAHPLHTARLFSSAELVAIVERYHFVTVDCFSPNEESVVIVAKAIQ